MRHGGWWILGILVVTMVLGMPHQARAQQFHMGVGWRTFLTNPSVDNEYQIIGAHLGTSILPPAYKQQLVYSRFWFVPFVGLEAGLVFSTVSRTDEGVLIDQNLSGDVNSSVRNFGFGLHVLLAPVVRPSHRLAFTMGFQFSNYAAKQDITFPGGSQSVTVKGNVIRIPVGILTEMELSRQASVEAAITFPIYAGGGFNFEAVAGNTRQTGKVGSFSTVFGSAGLSLGIFWYLL